MNHQVLSVEEARAFFNKITQEAFAPNLEKFKEIWKNGGIAIVSYDIYAQDPNVAGAARAFGLDPLKRVDISNLSPKKAAGFANSFPTDPITSKWFRRTNGERLFLMVGMGTFLINHENGIFSIEPGSSDHEYMS